MEQRVGFLLDYHTWKRSYEYRRDVIFILQQVTSDEEFQSIVLIADNYCECTDHYFCFYCMIYDVTQIMTAAAYLDTELLDLDELHELL